ncbi:hypothetical protein ACSNOK_24430 [Streptomyces sp. URMC 126]|uniref:hypothetical protein n=1 Tax=Streptomyces sp. URMC 126 TaxID=3423401 RepID=UPI003F1980D4
MHKAGVPNAAGDVAGEIYNAFFKPGFTGSLSNRAAPTRQELNFRACMDGTVRKVSGNRPLFRSSYMPDQYLYHHGEAITLEGAPSHSAAPVYRGNFVSFSRLIGIDVDPKSLPYTDCLTGSGHGGNPWAITVISGADVNPATGHFCLDPKLAADPEFSH